jgi:polyphosphate glucokinase
MAETLGIDIGGSGIKGALVNTETGELASERLRIPTPRPATPESVAETVRQLISELGYSGTVGCCFPTIVVDGRAKSASNMGEEWRDLAVDETFPPQQTCRSRC